MCLRVEKSKTVVTYHGKNSAFVLALEYFEERWFLC